MIGFALLGLVGAALAQDPTAIPDLNAQLYRPDLAGSRTLWADDTALPPSGLPHLALALGYARDPFVYEYDDGERIALLQDLLEADLIAGITLGRARLALDVPVYLLATGEGVAGPTGLGDLSLDGRATLLPRASGPVGVGLAGRLIFPTATLDGAVSNPVTAWEAALVVDREFGDLLVAANLGTRGVPEVALDELVLDDQFFFRLGGGWALTESGGVSLDLAGGLPWTTPISTAGSTPIEGMLGGWMRLNGDLVLRGGVGTGLTRGVGSPRMRDVLMLSWERQALRDRDGDGLADRHDPCRDQPEDEDGFDDADGCPDPSTKVLLRVEDPKAQAIVAATLGIDGKPLAALGTGLFQVELHPGQYAVAVRAEGFLPLDTSLPVPAQPETTVVYRLEPDVRDGLVRLVLAGPGGSPVEGVWTIDGVTAPATASGRAEIRIPPGAHTVVVKVQGFHPVERAITLKAGDTVDIPVTLQRVVITQQKIEIADSIYFELNKAVIKAESFPLLDEVAQILMAHPEIKRLRIEGHTDSRGAATTNLKLSQRRARAVQDYLVARGVEAGRLESAGFGESKPLDRRENEEAWAKNRRVDFFIVEQSTP